jgi:hypothetical protein
MKSAAVLLVALLGVLLHPLSAEPPVNQKPPPGVPEDATLFNGKWYRVYFGKFTWQQARDACQDAGGQLVVIPDKPTQAFLETFSKGVELWIGASDAIVEGIWVWVDGTEMKYKAWAHKQPKGGKKENYAVFTKKGWADTAAHSGAVGYICEWKDR